MVVCIVVNVGQGALGFGRASGHVAWGASERVVGQHVAVRVPESMLGGDSNLSKMLKRCAWSTNPVTKRNTIDASHHTNVTACNKLHCPMYNFSVVEQNQEDQLTWNRLQSDQGRKEQQLGQRYRATLCSTWRQTSATKCPIQILAHGLWQVLILTYVVGQSNWDHSGH